MACSHLDLSLRSFAADELAIREQQAGFLGLLHEYRSLRPVYPVAEEIAVACAVLACEEAHPDLAAVGECVQDVLPVRPPELEGGAVLPEVPAQIRPGGDALNLRAGPVMRVEMDVLDAPDIRAPVYEHPDLERTAEDIAYIVKLVGVRAEVDGFIRVDERDVNDAAVHAAALNRPRVWLSPRNPLLRVEERDSLHAAAR